MSNPYQAPNTRPTHDEQESDATRVVVSGQKLLMYAILGYIAASILTVVANGFLGGTEDQPEVTPQFFVVLGLGLAGILASAIGACLGIFRMGQVLYPGSTRYLYAIGVLIPAPLIGLIVMFVANASASGYLKARGFEIGFLGAKLPPRTP